MKKENVPASKMNDFIGIVSERNGKISYTINAVKESETVDIALLRSEGYCFIQRLWEGPCSRAFLDGMMDSIRRLYMDIAEMDQYMIDHPKTEEEE